MTHRKHLLLIGSVVVLLVSTGIILAQNTGAPDAAAPVDMKKVSYTIGVSMGKNLKREEIALNVDDFVAGLRDGLAGHKPRLTEAEMEEVMTAFQAAMRQQAGERAQRMTTENRGKGVDFLAKNKVLPGVKTTESGLQYKVIKDGAGKRPAATDTVTVHYRGALIDGTEFDSSYKRGKPAEFRVNGLIPGFTEALLLMKEGSKWQVFIPSDLAYGERGSAPTIEPNSVLVFELELIKIN